MDSLTQITLGAAMGELALGKKIGNRAILWGAIAGTMPDMDVAANFVSDEMSALAFHRAMTHSLLFAGIASLAFGWLVHRAYQRAGPGRLGADAAKVWLLLALPLAVGAAVLPIPLPQALGIAGAVSLAMLLLAGVALPWRAQTDSQPIAVQPSQRDWTLLFALAIFTHPILDCFTTYGTQLFLPFSSYRVSWNNISVVDPLYTLPFLVSLSIVSFMARTHPRRALVNYLGIGLSSAYMLFTLANKAQVEAIFRQSLAAEGIAYERLITSPTIFNNVLWNGIAEADSVYYMGLYSILDKEAKIQAFTRLPKGHDLAAPYAGQRVMQILPWFSDGYYTVSAQEGDTLIYSDLRFGALSAADAAKPNFVFRFKLQPDAAGVLQAAQFRDIQDGEAAFQQLLARIKGI